MSPRIISSLFSHELRHNVRPEQSSSTDLQSSWRASRPVWTLSSRGKPFCRGGTLRPAPRGTPGPGGRSPRCVRRAASPPGPRGLLTQLCGAKCHMAGFQRAPGPRPERRRQDQGGDTMIHLICSMAADMNREGAEAACGGKTPG